MTKFNELYNVVKIVSPSINGGEAKDQDRATFHAQTNTACVCDGTTTSPHSEKAAEIVSKSAKAFFNENGANLEAISNLLMANRKMAIEMGVEIGNSIPEMMRQTVQDAARESLGGSYQTTLTCVQFELTKDCVIGKTIFCGDSGFFAFNPHGEVLQTNLSKNNSQESCFEQEANDAFEVPFGAGKEILVKTVGNLTDHPDVANKENINNPETWIICEVICSLNKKDRPHKKASTIFLKRGEKVVIPSYYVSPPKDPQYKELGKLIYSQFLRRLSEKSPEQNSPYEELRFDNQGNTTEVLPDHFYVEQWTSGEERFPFDTSFLLCSDGFYRAFKNPLEMWKWLENHKQDFDCEQKKNTLLEELHNKLKSHSGDDDISFIWIYPKQTAQKGD